MSSALNPRYDSRNPPRRVVIGAALLFMASLITAGCADSAPSEPSIPTSAVTSLTLIRADGDQVVRAQVENPLDEAASFVVTVSLASAEGTKIGETTVTVTNVPPSTKKSGNSEPLSPTVPARTSLVLSGVERTAS